MIKQQLEQDLKQAVKNAGFGQVEDIVCNIPSNVSFGDFSSNIALQLSKCPDLKNDHSSSSIANKIIEQFPQTDYLDKIEAAPNGFINFFVKTAALTAQLYEISQKGKNYGQTNLGRGQKIQLEFISANPTGPMTLANGRGGALGDCLANILKWAGFTVETEFYINDTGNQVRILGESVKAKAGLVEVSENHYQGAYITDLVEVAKDNGWINLDSQELGHHLADYILDNFIKPVIHRFGIEFDNYFSERSLHNQEAIDQTLAKFRQSDSIYEKDGATWFRSTQFGDNQDRVLVTSEQARGRREPTYFLVDIAYHLNVFNRGFAQKINLWGADHHGYEPRVQAAMTALGLEGRLQILFLQFVRRFKNGAEVRMSKRAGTYVTLDELLDQVPSDAVRFFFLMYAPESHIDFNLNLAIEKSNKNPVFYVQYAHARMTSLLAKAGLEPGQFESRLLTHPAEVELIKHLSLFEELVENIAQTYQAHQLTNYSLKLADLFHKFYESCPVLTESDELKQARLGLVSTTRQVLKNALTLMGISAPDKM